ncbi:hypothetical protein [Agrobacterium sp. V1]|uniref:hypothetical protein n=1 Tax=Agrobacterium sp. V1 TaxID=3061957 RepID=UPI002672B36F|nr:hypothetical protein [Agrobacterium sp. V1]MDO3445118.1 hypothetical protein [Agrobacterium sp. V1]
MLAIVTFPQSAAKATPPEKAKPAESIVAPKSIFIVVPSGRGVAKTRVQTAPRPSARVLSVNNCSVAIPFAAISGVLRMAIVNQLPGKCLLRRVQVLNLRHRAAMFRSLAGCTG